MSSVPSGDVGSGPSTAAAYRVAQLLSRPNTTTTTTTTTTAAAASAAGGCGDLDLSSLRRLTAEIGNFLEEAPAAPPVYMEADSAPDGRRQNGAGPATEVELNVVAGVFEEQQPLGSGASGILLPTEANRRELDRRRAEEAQAFVDLAAALSPAGAVGSKVPVEEVEDRGRGCGEDSSDGEESSVVVMDADDLANEESSDDENEEALPPPQRRRIIEELN